MIEKLRILDVYSGLGGWSEAFRQRGHHVCRYDNDEKFRDVPDTVILDVLTTFVGGPGDFDVLLMSPPCQSVLAATGTHMTAMAKCGRPGCDGTTVRHTGAMWWCRKCGSGVAKKDTLWLEPRTAFGKLSVQLVDRALELVEIIKPRWWWMENPAAGMKHFVPDDIPRTLITFCAYGESRMKPSFIWGNWPDAWHPRPRCKNGDPCHERAPRGAKTGTQGIKGAAARALVPYELSEEVCLACEEALA